MENEENKRLLVFIFCVIIFGASFAFCLFGFRNNNWIHATNGTHQYQRGLNVDCQSIIEAPRTLSCRGWENLDWKPYNGSFGTLIEPDFGWSVCRFLAWITFIAPLVFLFLSVVVCCSLDAEKVLLQGKYLRSVGGLAAVTVVLNLLLIVIVSLWKRHVVDPIYKEQPTNVEIGIGFAFVQFSVIGFGLYFFGLILLLSPTVGPLLKMLPCFKTSTHQPVSPSLQGVLTIREGRNGESTDGQRERHTVTRRETAHTTKRGVLQEAETSLVMSFSWANLNLAKEALKNAQKKIDAVLDIRDDDVEGEEEEVEEIEEDENSITQSNQQPSFSTVDHADARSETATSECDHWSRELKHEESKQQVVVDTEPNPIHDMVPHSSSSLLNHSPNSSPDEAEHEHHGHRPSEQDSSEEKESVIVQEIDDGGFSSIPLDAPAPPESHRGISRRSSRHEDEMTVASSDIEVIRNIDAWWDREKDRTQNKHKDETCNNQLQMCHSLDALRGQLRHNEQRIDELTLINQKQQETNGQLQQRIVALNQTEKSLRKELAEKESARVEILEEGKKMSDYNGKQSREIRRLKAQVADVDKIKEDRKKYKEEKTAAEETIENLREEMESLQGKLQAAERALQEERNEKSANEIASEHHKNQYEGNSRRIADLERANTEKEELIGSLKEAKEALEEKLSSLSEEELAGRLASDRASHTAAIANQELLQLRQRNEQLRLQLAEAHLKLESAMDGKSNLVEAVARATAPLLAEIDELKGSLAEERNNSDDHDNLVRGLKTRLDESNRELNRLAEALNGANERSSTEQTHLLQRISKLEGHQSNLVAAHSTQLEGEREERRKLQEELRRERKRIEELKEESEAIRAVAANLSGHESIAAASPQPSHPLGYSLTHGSSAAESELSSLLRNHELNTRRISELEVMARRSEEQIERRDQRLKELTGKYKEMEFQYESLLEMDGEKLEKIEELQNDIVDLRQLLKDQLIAFAEAR
ncbi:hypothetical protein PFISCL1PPCAC_27303, partial [Pristionchus fissidentatus]